MVRSTLPGVSVAASHDDRGGDPPARLGLAEFFLGSLDLASSAGSALSWLSQHCQVHSAVCLVLDPAGRRLVPAASRGYRHFGAGTPAVDLEEDRHPFVRALWAAEPTLLEAATDARPAPLRGPMTAYPLRARGARTQDTAGLLLVAAGERAAGDNVRWLATVLGDQVFRLRSRDTLAETRFGRERMLLHSIVNAVTDPILLTDPDGRLVIGNTAAERLLTAPEDASEGWRQAVALNNMLFSAALSSSAIESDHPTRRELVLADPSEGSELLFELLSTMVLDRREGTAVVSVLRNVTDLGRASREIEESYRRLRVAQAEVRDQRRQLELIINSVADPIVVTDPERDIVLMNTRAETLFRLDGAIAESAQRHVRTNGARFSSFVSTLLSSGAQEGWRSEMRLVDPASAATLPVEAIAGTVLSESGELVWIVTILHDLTETVERARLYEQVKRASAELEAKVQAATIELAEQNELLRRQRFQVEQASALKSQFLANMSHEFRTPLNAILGYTQILLQGVGGTLTDDQQTDLERIDSNGRHLLALINDILDLSRIEAGRMPVHMTDLDVPELVAEVLDELDPIIRRSTLGLTAKLPKTLPPMRSDRQKVKQILLNLISNALKFTSRGSVRVLARHVAARQQMAITVKDTGIGIARADQERIFEDFWQLDASPSRAHSGTGLGLSICRRLAVMLGGAIAVTSRPGHGSAFTLSLPIGAGEP